MSQFAKSYPIMREKEREGNWLLLLGGLRYLIPVIREARRLGLRVATADYIPSNPAHAYADRYFNADVTDRQHILKIARELPAAGVMAFAVDPAVTTAAYVAEQLGLPSAGSYAATCILQHKGKFRRFLAKNGFNTPEMMVVESGRIEAAEKDATECQRLLRQLESEVGLPMIVKPVDSAGSKGVGKASTLSELPELLRRAREFSREGSVIVERIIEADGYPSDSDMMVEDGEIKLCSFSDQIFDAQAPNPFVPAAFRWPAVMDAERRGEARRELQRLLHLLEIRSGLFNVELRYGRRDGKLYIMEVSPRGGGNRLAEMVECHCGAPLIRAAIAAAIGWQEGMLNDSWDENVIQKEGRCVAEIVLHARKDGIWQSPEWPRHLHPYIIEEDYWVKDGANVESFTGANHTIGIIRFGFPDRFSMERYLPEFQNLLQL